MARLKASEIPRVIWKRITKNSAATWIRDHHELCVFELLPDNFVPDDRHFDFQVNSLEAIECFDESERWHRRERFISAAKERLENGLKHYGYVENGILITSAWATIHQKKAHLGDVKQDFLFPPKSCAIFEAYTHPNARRRGLYKACMSKMAEDLINLNGAQQVYGFVTPDNIGPVKVLSSLGFKHTRTLVYDRAFGKEEKRQDVL